MPPSPHGQPRRVHTMQWAWPWLDRSVGQKRDERHAFPSCDPWEKLSDCRFEVVGRLMRAPGGFVDIELEDEELQRVFRGAIGEKKFDARLCHCRRRHDPE